MTGKIVVNEDEWPLSSKGFEYCSEDATTYCTNVAKWFVGKGNKGNFLAYSTNYGVNSAQLKNAMEGAGHTWTLDATVPFTIESVKQYDGIFLSGYAADNQVLIDYVNGGGNVYLCGGTGKVGDGFQWNSFLNAFGFEFEGSYNGSIAGARPIANTHPVLAGVTQLYFCHGSAINDIKPDDTKNGILVSYDTGGCIGVYDGAPPLMKIVVNENDWPLSSKGFEYCSEGATTYCTNVAKWFVGKGNKGNFLAYSTNYGVNSAQLKNAMEGAGHTWTLDATVPFTIESVKQYDGIFLSGNVADNQVLIDYVNGGGNVYLCGGTGAVAGGAAGEAEQWKSFLNAFGFEFEGKSYNGSNGARPIADTHPVLAGVTQLYFDNGSAINDIKPDDTANGILVSYDTGGAIGVYDGKIVS